MTPAWMKRAGYFVWVFALSLILPGLGHIALGVKRRGSVHFGLVALLVLALGVMVLGFGASWFIPIAIYIYAVLIFIAVADVIYCWFTYGTPRQTPTN